MKKLRQIADDNNALSIQIILADDGSYMLRRYIKNWDDEEGIEYETELRPHPSSRFGDIEEAEKEARRLLSNFGDKGKQGGQC